MVYRVASFRLPLPRLITTTISVTEMTAVLCKMKKTFKQAGTAGISVLLCLSFFGCTSSVNQKTTKYDHSTILMGTVVSESVYLNGEDNSSDIFSDIDSVIDKLENENLSWRVKSSDVYNINTSENESEGTDLRKTQVSKVTADCIRRALEIGKASDGALDISIGAVSHLWNFDADSAAHTPPPDSAIKEQLSLVDYSRDYLSENNFVFTAKGQELDLGAVGKGLACDEVAKYLNTKKDISGAIVSVGGSVLLYGKNPERKDGTYNVAVRDPFGSSNDYMGVLNLPGGTCISTSGDYEKTFVYEGKTYHHILNPKTGYPAESNITGVTVVSGSGIDTDALSTAVFIMGYGDKALDLLKKYDAEAVFITHDKKVYVTDGLKDKFTLPESAAGFTVVD